MTILPNGFYTHYKHDPNGEPHNFMYEVVGLARHTENEEYLVLYRPLYKSDWFAPAGYSARPLEMFLDYVEKEGNSKSRFQQVTDPVLIKELEKVRDQMYP